MDLSKKLIIDTHIHTSICKHAKGDPEDYILKAIEKNVDILGFSEHAYFFGIDQIHRPEDDEQEEFLNKLKKLKEKYKDQIKILIGLEVEFLPSQEDKLREYLKDKELDFTIGSVHYAEDINNSKNVNVNGLYNRKQIYYAQKFDKYFQMLGFAVKSGLFDYIAHPDLVMMVGLESEEFTKKIKSVINLMKTYAVGYEINTSGFLKKVYFPESDTVELNKNTIPNFKAIKLAAEDNVPLVIGSDAHSPNHLCRFFDKTKAKLKELGINKLSYFENGEKIDYDM